MGRAKSTAAEDLSEAVRQEGEATGVEPDVPRKSKQPPRSGKPTDDDEQLRKLTVKTLRLEEGVSMTEAAVLLEDTRMAALGTSEAAEGFLQAVESESRPTGVVGTGVGKPKTIRILDQEITLSPENRSGTFYIVFPGPGELTEEQWVRRLQGNPYPAKLREHLPAHEDFLDFLIERSLAAWTRSQG